MKHYIFLFLLVCFIPSFLVARPANIEVNESVATSFPILGALAREILHQTPVTVLEPFGSNIVLNELENLAKEHTLMLDTLAFKIDAVLDFRSIIPADPLFVQLRHRNIHIVEIDCATPPSPVLSAIATLREENTVNPYVWLSLSNMLRMAEIMEHDLKKLYPKYHEQITQNMNSLKQRTTELRNQFNKEFLQIESFTAITLSESFDYLLKDIDLFVLGEYPPEFEWTENEKQSFEEQLSIHTVAVVVHQWDPQSPAQELMKTYDINAAVLQTGIPGGGNFDLGVLPFYEKNLQALLTALKKEKLSH